MLSLIVLVTLLAASTVAAPAIAATKHAHRVVHATGKTCKGEFMYMKGGKCVDARLKA
jgi:hypothetical protein